MILEEALVVPNDYTLTSKEPYTNEKNSCDTIFPWILYHDFHSERSGKTASEQW